MTQSNKAPIGAVTATVTADGPRDFREIHKPEVPLRVCAFRFADVSTVWRRRRLPNAGTYVLAFHATKQAYPGQSGNLCERLPRYLTDPTKGSADEVFIFFAPDGGLDAASRLHLEARLLDIIDRTNVYRPLNRTRPHPSKMSGWEEDKLDRKLLHTLPLLPAIGCDFIDPAGAGVLLERNDSGSGNPPGGDTSGAGMEKSGAACSVKAGVNYMPAHAKEVELVYRDLWARGYQAPFSYCRPGRGEFVVAVGSEMRKIPGAVSLEVLELRDMLVRTGAAVPLPGLLDRFWLAKPVAFPSPALAAAVLTGSEDGSDRWQRVQADAPCVSPA